MTIKPPPSRPTASRRSPFDNETRALARRLLLAVLWLIAFSPFTASAQSAANGKALYNSFGCAAGTCHSPDPTRNQNRIRNGSTVSGISFAIATVGQMSHLQGAVNTAQMADLAAYIANPAAANSAPAITVQQTAVDFGSVAVGATSSPQSITVVSSGTAALSLSGFASSRPEFTVSGGTCAPGISLAAGASCTIDVRFAPSGTAASSGVLAINHNASVTATSVLLSGTGSAGTSAVTTMVEYRHGPLDYYFMTSRASDMALLDAVADFQRTGQTFPVYASQQPGTQGITRFYFDKIALNGGRGTHFYTLVTSEKDALHALNPANALAPRLPFDEGIDSFAFLPAVEGIGGSCAAGQIPVYRMFRSNGRFPDNPNHRFTTSLVLYNEFVGLGWDGEGVKFCTVAP